MLDLIYAVIYESGKSRVGVHMVSVHVPTGVPPTVSRNTRPFRTVFGCIHGLHLITYVRVIVHETGFIWVRLLEFNLKLAKHRLNN